MASKLFQPLCYESRKLKIGFLSPKNVKGNGKEEELEEKKSGLKLKEIDCKKAILFQWNFFASIFLFKIFFISIFKWLLMLTILRAESYL